MLPQNSHQHAPSISGTDSVRHLMRVWPGQQVQHRARCARDRRVTRLRPQRLQHGTYDPSAEQEERCAPVAVRQQQNRAKKLLGSVANAVVRFQRCREAELIARAGQHVQAGRDNGTHCRR